MQLTSKQLGMDILSKIIIIISMFTKNSKYSVHIALSDMIYDTVHHYNRPVTCQLYLEKFALDLFDCSTSLWLCMFLLFVQQYLMSLSQMIQPLVVINMLTLMVVSIQLLLDFYCHNLKLEVDYILPPAGITIENIRI